MEVGGRDQEVRRGRIADGIADHLGGLRPEWQPVLRLGRPRLALGIVERPLVQGDDALPGRLHEELAQLDGLGQDDLLLRRQEGDLADLLEVHPDRVVDPDHVRRERLELLRRGLLELLGVELRRRVEGDLQVRVRLDPDLDTQVGGVGEGVGRREDEIVVLRFVLLVDDGGRLERAHAGEASRLHVVLGPPRAAEDGLDE